MMYASEPGWTFRVLANVLSKAHLSLLITRFRNYCLDVSHVPCHVLRFDLLHEVAAFCNSLVTFGSSVDIRADENRHSLSIGVSRHYKDGSFVIGET